MKLFEFDENFDVVVSPQALTLEPFKKVLEKYTDKSLGITELSYIVFMHHPDSDYSDIRDEKERSKTIIESIVNGKKLKLDKITDKALEFYIERSHTPTSLYLESNLNALSKLTEYYNNINFTLKDAKDNLVFDPKKVVDTMKESPKLMVAIRELKEQIKKEQELEGGIRGSGQKGIYEDGN